LELFGGRIRFDRNELAGAFGDIGTDLPLIVGMLLAMKPLTPAGEFLPLVTGVFVLFGLGQVASGLIYGLPMPVQPLKAMAAIVIAKGMSPEILFGGGLAVGVIMLVLTLSKALEWLARVIPLAAVRGVQLGLGLKLAGIALTKYVPGLAPGMPAPSDFQVGVNYAIAAGGAVVVLLLWGNRKLPGALLLITGGLFYAVTTQVDFAVVGAGFGFTLPALQAPGWDAIVTGAVVLALPQVPLSLSNSVIGTAQTTKDLFPDRPVSVSRIGLSYSLLNLVNPFLGGLPICHGCGGLAGHHAFGGRTGGSPVIYGTLFLVVGLFFAAAFTEVVGVFPLPVLGTLLCFEAVALMRLVADVTAKRRELFIALLVGVTAASVPYGFLIGLCAGTALCYLWKPAALAEAGPSE
jgi:xanthine/uracil/vitamin C permease (AzgA family)